MSRLIIHCLLLLGGWVPLTQAQEPMWDISLLKQAPHFRWGNTDTATVRQLFYEGLAFGERPRTEVFAYYATPGSLAHKLASDRNLPAIVLVHGGGGRAFRQWAERWAKRGYAALAMDLGANGPDGKPLSTGNSPQDSYYKFASIDTALNQQWPYHAVANVMLAHSLLRSLPGVDSSRTAITGISWGGYLTCIVAGLDNRFKVAVPVYGCGFMDEPGGFFPDHDFGKLTADQQARWLRRYDASHYVGAARMPFLWVTGATDRYYPPTSFARTYRLVSSPAQFRLTATMTHGHEAGWTPPEIGAFIDHYLLHGMQLVQIDEIQVRRKVVRARVITPVPIAEASLSYTTDTVLPYEKRAWTTVPATLRQHTLTAQRPPDETTIWLFNVRDERGYVTSSPFQFGAESALVVKK